MLYVILLWMSSIQTIHIRNHHYGLSVWKLSPLEPTKMSKSKENAIFTIKLQKYLPFPAYPPNVLFNLLEYSYTVCIMQEIGLGCYIEQIQWCSSWHMVKVYPQLLIAYLLIFTLLTMQHISYFFKITHIYSWFY